MNTEPIVPALARRAFMALLATTALPTPTQAQAQDYRGVVKILVGYPPGGPADTVARVIADKLAAQLGQTVIVENRAGAGGQIAALALKAAPADGSVIFLSNLHTVATIPLITKSPGYAPATDFRPVGAVATFELALAVHPLTRAATMSQLGQFFSANPGRASIGVPAASSTPECLATQVSRHFKAESLPVAYKGATPMVQDLLGGQVSAGVSAVSDFLQHHQAGKLRIVAVTKATPLLPDVPSFAAAGLAGLELTDLLGLYAPAALPTVVVARYNAALNRVLAWPEVAEKLQALAMTPVGGSAAAHAERLASNRKTLAELVRAVGYTPQ